MKSREGPWLFSPALDLLIGCGAWSLPLMGLAFFLSSSHGTGLGLAFYCLGLFCNNPHYMATIYRAYRTPTEAAKYRFFTVYVTVLILATVVLLHFAPNLVPWAVTLYLTWSPWHYTGQNFGIAQLFVRRGGGTPDPVARHLLWWSYALSYLGWFVALHARRDEVDTNFVSLGIPPQWAGPLQVLLAVGFVTCALLAFRRLVRQVPAKMLRAPALLTFTQALWFVLPSLLARFNGLSLPASYFSAGALAFMHCAQYLWITTYFARKDEKAGSFSFARYYGILVVGGIALFVPGPWIASRLLGHDFVDSFLIFMALVNLHHFILDGALWKLRDGRIARLLIGTPQPADPADQDRGSAEHLAWLFGKASSARVLRWSLASGLLLIGAIDQAQNYFTARNAPEASLQTANFLNPADPRVAFRKAQLLEQQGDLPDAETELRRIVGRNPYNGPAERALGEVLLAENRNKDALEQYNRIAGLFHQDVVVATNRGVLERALGNPKAAADRFREGLDLAPTHSELHAYLGEALDSIGKKPEAIAEYRTYMDAVKVAETEPAGGAPRVISVSLRLAQLEQEAGRTKEAMDDFRFTGDFASSSKDFASAAVALEALAKLQAAQGDSSGAQMNRDLASKALALARQNGQEQLPALGAASR